MRPASLSRTLLLLDCAGLLRAETELERASRLMKAKGYPEAQQVLERALQANPRNAKARLKALGISS